ncbi:Proteinase inhibitor I4 serpin OS=Tsukamurella paurometabola (strain ATCC 8368 / DSM / CCUG 35730 / CIP 100753 / JCM 10117 / KCTC 9821 / NBRC 16120 / NCIMB 702349 / NCTC 13040) OX=521096 GN=Tpau_0925 PE=3 SV=1 [Tsukamurella paurometabola]|uniref:Proteinase inhibitor I4 serpin n=1 Tax=Tsukamurella paurometabola (strain ATCC 8368 / DSM 20162 / CCUG 35730 / CIP 100753 / JCM 10117 / KCTC 9821 / NBRC 16120 / NCIMB 702349 / NCTC 13040) TaxID=521096 RepID=D5UUI8_TSUPD|nr:serpin family protein [Tsukamurella paurometabola]ADG77559.1 proteinase inhibitor I4 serpin [Tsukamurella paurometabola DSM 20162]SUP27704.1 Serine protease inhibitor [Tsukamurella paurometabola]
MQIRRAAITLLAAATLTACGGSPPAPGPLALDRPTTAFDQVGIDDTRTDVAALVNTATRIGTRLIAPDGRASATAVSPWSVLSLLGMLRAGADGTAAAQLDALGLSGARDVPRAMAALTGQTGQWAGDPGKVPAGTPPAAPLFQSQVALLTAQQLEPRGEYLDRLAKYYGTGVYPVDFARGIDQPLGEWVAVNTGSTLTSAPLRTDRDTRLAAATTAYLAVAWRFPFDAAQTRPRPFTTADGAVVEPPTMRATVPARVAGGDGFTALQLDFGVGTLALQVILPNPGVPLADGVTEGRFTAARLALAGAPTAAHEVSLPKWRSAGWTGLVDPLRELGVTGVFPGGAGLSGIADGEPTLADARASAVLTVGEKGTASDSATTPAPEPPPGPEPVTVDRAFAYSVVDTATGLPLLMGTVNRPAG